jgi:AraC-like DNA-binding protein
MSFRALVERANRYFDRISGPQQDPVLGLLLLREQAPTEFEAMIYDPIVCLILQGEKVIAVGSHVFTASEGHCVVVSHDLPVLSRITRASARKPYLALVIRLDLAVLRSLYDEVGDCSLPPGAACSMEVAPVDDATADVITRYLDLLDDPMGARVLLPLVRKELHFRLYTSASGAMLRSLLRRDSHASNIARAIRTLRQTFRESLAVAELAKSVGMSTSSFHKHFKALTMTTPLRYQKDLRLTQARLLLRGGASTVTEAAFAVGYESASQFSREYARKFGTPPRSELASARTA